MGLREEEKSFVPGVVDVVIFDEAVCAARVEHLALGIHRHGHNGSAVVLQCLQNVVGRSLLQSFVGLTCVQSRLIGMSEVVTIVPQTTFWHRHSRMEWSTDAAGFLAIVVPQLRGVIRSGFVVHLHKDTPRCGDSRS